MIDTRVEGSPESVESLAAWLRSSLGVQVVAAAELAASARSYSAGVWEGGAAEEYRDEARRLVKVTDRHASRVERSALLLDRYAARLRGSQDRMAGIRVEAATGGLLVIGTVVHDPPPASPEELRQLYTALAEEVALARQAFVDWIDAELAPEPRSLESDASAVDRMVESAEFRSVVMGFAFAGYPAGLRRRAKELEQRAKEFRSARRSGHPGRRAFGNRPETRTKVQQFGRIGGHLGKGAKFLGPMGIGFEAWSAGQQLAAGESPGKVISSTAAGVAAGLGAAVLVAGTAGAAATAPAWGTVALVGVGAAGATFITVKGVEVGWDKLPDGVTEAVDNGLKKGWEKAKDVTGGTAGFASQGWNMVTGWL